MTAAADQPGEYVRRDQLRACKRCGAPDLVWHRSTKTGRYYLCNTAPSQGDMKNAMGVRYRCPWSAHRCDEYRAEQERGSQAMADARREEDERQAKVAVLETMEQVRDEQGPDSQEYFALKAAYRQLFQPDLPPLSPLTGQPLDTARSNR